LIKFNETDNTIEWSSLGTRPSSIRGFFGGSKKEQISTVNLDDIKEVKKGIQTEVLHKGGLLDPNACFSIITAERTLDLVLESASDRNKVLTGLKVLLESKNVSFS
jgi:hypothetical protein